jgi:serine/threonine protein phosphatase PrpC
MATLKSIIRCEAAGRDNNEDSGKIIRLGGDKGELLVVCDGMGGMEAGEVASALAVATIEEWFLPERITPGVLARPADYMMQSIVGADTNIKDYTKKDPKTQGMGSTIVMAWLLGQKMYVAWCGDSRAYRYNPQLGLERLSRDHSLVQSWVDAGQITEEQAFDHPQSNIITRSLGDPNGVAAPEAAEYDLYTGDVILLGSEGLCGTLRDGEIEAVLSQSDDLKTACDQLWKADEAAGWHDNVTTAMAQVVAGGATLAVAEPEIPEDNGIEVLPEEPKNTMAHNAPTMPQPESPKHEPVVASAPEPDSNEERRKMGNKRIIMSIVVLFIVGLAITTYRQFTKPEPNKLKVTPDPTYHNRLKEKPRPETPIQETETEKVEETKKQQPEQQPEQQRNSNVEQTKQKAAENKANETGEPAETSSTKESKEKPKLPTFKNPAESKTSTKTETATTAEDKTDDAKAKKADSQSKEKKGEDAPKASDGEAAKPEVKEKTNE